MEHVRRYDEVIVEARDVQRAARRWQRVGFVLMVFACVGLVVGCAGVLVTGLNAWGWFTVAWACVGLVAVAGSYVATEAHLRASRRENAARHARRSEEP